MIAVGQENPGGPFASNTFEVIIARLNRIDADIAIALADKMAVEIIYVRLRIP